jgi:hypothetical protein
MFIISNIKSINEQSLTYHPYRDLRIPDTGIAMGKLCPCFFQEKPRAGVT